MRNLRTPLAEAAASFLLARHDLAPKTRDNYRLSFHAFDKWLSGGNGTLGDLTAANVNAYVAETVKAGHRFMARNVVALLKVFEKWLVQSDIVDASVLAVVKLPRVPTEGRATFSDDEVRGILDVARHTRYGPRDYAIVTLALGCGLRLNEIRELQIDDFDFRDGVLTVRAETSKSRRTRQVVLDPIAGTAVDTYIRDWRRAPRSERTVFTTNRGEPFTREGFSRLFYALKGPMERAGVPNFICHRMRHTWATNCHRLGQSMIDIQEQGGWKKIEMVRRYTNKRPIHELKRLPTALAGMLRSRRGAA